METKCEHPATMHYKVITVKYSGNNNWNKDVEDDLNVWAVEGYRPILYGDAGGQCTVILEKISE